MLLTPAHGGHPLSSTDGVWTLSWGERHSWPISSCGWKRCQQGTSLDLQDFCSNKMLMKYTLKRSLGQKKPLHFFINLSSRIITSCRSIWLRPTVLNNDLTLLTRKTFGERNPRFCFYWVHLHVFVLVLCSPSRLWSPPGTAGMCRGGGGGVVFGQTWPCSTLSCKLGQTCSAARLTLF